VSRLPNVYPVRLTSATVVLREVEPDDARAAFRWGSDPEFFRFLPFDPVRTIDEEQQFIDGLIRVARSAPRMDYHLAITLADTAEMVGLVDLRVASVRHRSAELGFGLGDAFRGRGLATEAARLIIEFGFKVLGLHRVAAGHHPENFASQRVVQRLGMKSEGRLRENLLAHGEWRDSLVYAVLEHEWPTAGH
jgi:[ribosomal protein S5]-alanine N-acetyltransferase